MGIGKQEKGMLWKMANMSYCRFQNTLSNLRDCYENWEGELSEDEQKAQRKLLELCDAICSMSSNRRLLDW